MHDFRQRKNGRRYEMTITPTVFYIAEFRYSGKSSVDRDLDDRMPEVRLDDNTVEHKQKLEPFYIQRKGKLSIIRASPASQGVYFCYDTQSRSNTAIFYVVMAMTPPVRMSDMEGVLTDGCYDTKDYGFIRANFNWRYHFVPNIRHEAPKQCHRRKKGFCEKDYFTQVDPEKDCTLEFCRKEFKESEIELNLALELRWEPWGECVGSRQLQKREAHCYLVRKSGYQIPDRNLDKKHDWMTKLNTLFNHEPFTSKGIRLYSSLLASLFVDENVMTKCYYEEKYEKTDRIWRVILHTMTGRYKNGKFNDTVVELDKNGNVIGRPPTFRLSNPFQACMA
ncbi:unnamed protein product [Angiostrongylus costaricensis]|uniref:Ig-like domain-containing protein n=1 Tax=Angiostrongylus costaricensis TaxID=334426 RepID=A0A0R3PLU1_ANGCS|nr:unnamed protein product [Angiostrongylus costaricensis]